MIQDCEKGTCIEENKRKECPYWAELFTCTFVILLDILVCKYYIDTQQVEWIFPIFSYGFAVLCICWWLFLSISRCIQSGIGGFYDIYWYCNIALLLTAVGIVLGSPTLIGQSMCLLLLPHITFWIDIFSYPCFKVCPINAFPYMFDKATPFLEKFTSIHHFWYFPGLIVVLWKQPLLSLWSYGISIILFGILNFLSYFMTPKEYIYEDGTTRYLNICVAHEYPEFARKIPPFKYTIGKSFWFMFFITVTCYIIPANLIAYLIIIGLQKCVNSFF